MAVVARDEVVEREGLWRGGERKGDVVEGEGFLVVDLGLVEGEEEEEDKWCMAASLFFFLVLV